MIRRSVILNIHKLFHNSSLYDNGIIGVLYCESTLNSYYSTINSVECYRKYQSFVRFCSDNSAPSHSILYDVLKLRDKTTSNSTIDNNVNELCNYYTCLKHDAKRDFLLALACKFAVHHDAVCKVANTLVKEHCDTHVSVRIHERLKTTLTPKYKWLFIHVGRQENGVKFLVDMRTDLLDLLKQFAISDDNMPYLQQLNNTLRELLLLWFSVGFLKLERVTWKSSCEMLQKISDYEAVHPMRSWTDLKKRMGPDRRCFVYTHASMPDEPLVILHTALRGEIASSTVGIIRQDNNNNEIQLNSEYHQPDRVKAAVFYSISATQAGLQGIELGNYIIKRVATELAKEFPKLDQFSSLSPIPKFKVWLFDVLKAARNDPAFARQMFTGDELAATMALLQTEDVFKELSRQLNSNTWLQNRELVVLLQPLLMRMCVRYLYVEKKRGYALDSVANFHLRNGAEMWRVNWLADLSARGLTTSCGIMVNYRYYLDEAEHNSKAYIEHRQIVISPLVQDLLERK